MPRVCKYIQSFTWVRSVKTSIESGYVYQQNYEEGSNLHNLQEEFWETDSSIFTRDYKSNQDKLVYFSEHFKTHTENETF
jgi:hypothetical protein